MAETPKDCPCPSCGNIIIDRFCSHCGEERLRPELRGVAHLVRQLLEDLTSIDGKIGSTLKLILFKPGQFELNYFCGRRVDFLKPITFFLLINVLYVMFSPITDFYVSFVDQLTMQPYSPWIAPWVKQQIAALGYTLQEFQSYYDQLVKVLARSLIIIQVPIFALLSYLICFRREYYFADYLIFSLNFHAWLLIWIIVAQLPAWLIVTLADWVGLREWVSGIYFLLLPLGLIAYLAIAMHRFWQFRWWSLLLRLVALVAAFQIAHSCYRLIQFYITFYMVQVPDIG
ncbi:MAG: DUF3667 domain-containing protein [Gammaproteobacteria bacterium]|nr:DUF3667 domain-containing protein [Gammaproteobacteria bacterium]